MPKIHGEEGGDEFLLKMSRSFGACEIRQMSLKTGNPSSTPRLDYSNSRTRRPNDTNSMLTKITPSCISLRTSSTVLLYSSWKSGLYSYCTDARQTRLVGPKVLPVVDHPGGPPPPSSRSAILPSPSPTLRGPVGPSLPSLSQEPIQVPSSAIPRCF